MRTLVIDALRHGSIVQTNRRLERLDVGGLKAFLALSHIKRDFLTVLQRLEALSPNFGKVGEQVVTTIIGRDEAEAFGVVEPFNCASCHCVDPFARMRCRKVPGMTQMK